MNTHLIAGQQIPLTPDGNWLYLKAAQGEIDVYREVSGERVTLGQSAVFNVGEGKQLGRLLISSRIDNEIEIQFGFGTFTPPVEGQSVVIQALPSVEINTLPPMQIAENQQVTIQDMPAMAIAPNQQLAVSQLPQLNIASLPAVVLDGVPSMKISSMPAIRISAAQVVRVAEEASSELITEAVSTFPHNIAQNNDRKAITIKAAKSNTESVFVDAFELEAGERIEIASKAAMTLTGAAGDKVTLMEI
ncbi:hypothetical protein BCT11_14975 [Vibrio sp. 10N.222.52.B12]|uniref:hypothetical protein n=1 Tax=Vibrio sp. 10N.222.52.B12 TaxID=1880840 RepID=UPI000C857C39|nr:hypothetical protein [Vibrio sp. 10N.222.52.B12]PMO39591.1 hypothetical protein BCT11_14975 [Vibrio sp. 10N.222.52.B12]